MGLLGQSRHLALLALLALVSGGLSACSMSQTAEEDDSIELAGGPDTEEVAQTDAAPAESAELAPQPAPEQVAEATPPVAAPAPEPVAEKVEQKIEEPAPVVASSGDGQSHTVRAGDTLMKIAFENYGDVFSWKKIFEANSSSISDPNRLDVGVVLSLPRIEGRAPASIPEGSEKYQIQQGDTLGTISGKVYGDRLLWKRLWEQNKSWIKNPNKIFAGFFVYYTLSDEDRARVPASK